jgi:hypothetical protein
MGVASRDLLTLFLRPTSFAEVIGYDFPIIHVRRTKSSDQLKIFWSSRPDQL